MDIDTGYYPGVNHALASLAASVRNNGHYFSFHHLRSVEPTEKVVERALNEKPNIVGFSFTSPQKKYISKYLTSFSNLGILLIAGGIHPTIAPDEVLNMDFSGVAIGEAEFSLPELLSRIDRGDDNTTVPGFWWKSSDGTLKCNPVSPLEPLAKFPLPDYSIFDIKTIEEDSAGWIPVMMTRGCPYNCSYCCNHVLRSIYPNKKDYVRFQPIDNAIKLIEHNIKFYSNVKGIRFDDDLLVYDEEWFKQFAKRYKNNIGLPYTCLGRVGHFSDEVIGALKESGCSLVAIGIESGSEWLRRNLLNRNETNVQITECFKRLQNARIMVSSFNIVGFPFETKKHMKETLAINKIIKPNTGSVYYFYPFTGTNLLKICKQFDLVLDEDIQPSGYLEKPMVKDVHCSNHSCIKMYNKIRLYLASCFLIRSLNLPNWFINIFYLTMNIFPALFVGLITKRSILKTKIRKMGLKIFFKGPKA